MSAVSDRWLPPATLGVDEEGIDEAGIDEVGKSSWCGGRSERRRACDCAIASMARIHVNGDDGTANVSA